MKKIQPILNDLKAKKYKSVYFLEGDESYYIDKVTDFMLNNIIDKDAVEFDLSVMFGKDCSGEELIATLRRFPMMGSYHLVVLKEAQDFRQIDILQKYLDQPLPTTLFLICYKHKKPDGRKQIFKALRKAGVHLKSEKLRDYKVGDWIEEYLIEKKIGIVPSAKNLLVEYLGTDLSKIVNAISKLTIVLKEGDKITPALIEKNIGISKDYNVFELQKAITKRDMGKVFKIADYFSQNSKGHPLVLSLGMLYSFFSKILIFQYSTGLSSGERAKLMGISPYFMKDYEDASRNYSPGKIVKIIKDLRQFDLKSKGVGSTGINNAELLKELLYRIVR